MKKVLWFVCVVLVVCFTVVGAITFARLPMFFLPGANYDYNYAKYTYGGHMVSILPGGMLSVFSPSRVACNSIVGSDQYQLGDVKSDEDGSLYIGKTDRWVYSLTGNALVSCMFDPVDDAAVVAYTVILPFWLQIVIYVAVCLVIVWMCLLTVFWLKKVFNQ